MHSRRRQRGVQHFGERTSSQPSRHADAQHRVLVKVPAALLGEDGGDAPVELLQHDLAADCEGQRGRYGRARRTGQRRSQPSRAPRDGLGLDVELREEVGSDARGDDDLLDARLGQPVVVEMPLDDANARDDGVGGLGQVQRIAEAEAQRGRIEAREAWNLRRSAGREETISAPCGQSSDPCTGHAPMRSAAFRGR